MKTQTRDVRKILLKRKLVHLSMEVRGDDIKSYTSYAMEIDLNYPWAGSFTGEKADAAAFTVGFVRTLRKSIASARRSGFPASMYTITPVDPATHEGRIFFMPDEIK